MRSIVLALALSLVLLTGCTEKPAGEPTPSAPEEQTSSSSPMANIPLLSGMQTVILKTSLGDITLELDANAAPKTVTNFVKLAQEGYYNDLLFHRVIKDFMIQGGDPDGNGSGGESIFGATFEDEINAASYGLDKTTIADVAPPDQLEQLPAEMRTWTLQQYYESQGFKYRSDVKSLPMKRGAIAMANRGPNTNGSQFFINTAANNFLDDKHTVFGKVTAGMDVVKAIENTPTGQADRPIAPVIINSILLN